MLLLIMRVDVHVRRYWNKCFTWTVWCVRSLISCADDVVGCDPFWSFQVSLNWQLGAFGTQLERNVRGSDSIFVSLRWYSSRLVLEFRWIFQSIECIKAVIVFFGRDGIFLDVTVFFWTWRYFLHRGYDAIWRDSYFCNWRTDDVIGLSSMDIWAWRYFFGVTVFF